MACPADPACSQPGAYNDVSGPDYGCTVDASIDTYDVTIECAYDCQQLCLSQAAVLFTYREDAPDGGAVCVSCHPRPVVPFDNGSTTWYCDARVGSSVRDVPSGEKP